jgi:hypothetical protein
MDETVIAIKKTIVYTVSIRDLKLFEQNIKIRK